MSDEYTMELRLCDAAGMVSCETVIEVGRTTPSNGESYLDRINRLRNLTLQARGDDPETIPEPFACTGSAHLAGQHIRCTSPAHDPLPPVARQAMMSAFGVMGGASMGMNFYDRPKP